MTGRTVGVLAVCGIAAVAGGGIWVLRGAAAPSPALPEPVVVAVEPAPAVETPAPRVRPTPPPRAEPVVESAPVEPRAPAAINPPPADDAARDQARKEAWEKMRAEAVKRFDKDGDGKLDDEERAAMRAEFEKRGGEVRQLMVRRFDADGDGQLNEQEMDVARKEIREVRQQIRDRIVPEYDLDGDGELSDSEREAARPAFEAEFSRLRVIALLDKDSSRSIEPAELAAAIIAISDGDSGYDLNQDGVVDYRDASYASEIAQTN
ncbi:MAG: EF-hand domain-containing protein [Phycisphaerales bacterium]|nr:EF-hand domain-containing protein [Phycisphaerales bacterium]